MKRTSDNRPLTPIARVAIALWIACALHVVTVLAAAYAWVFFGAKFPPFVHYDDGIFMFVVLSFLFGFAGAFATINPAVDGWRKDGRS